MDKMQKLSPKVFESLSAYIDGQLSPEEAQAIEAKLAASIKFQQAHDQLKAMRATVRAMPQRKAPRNFILTRAEAAEAKRGRNWSRAFGLAFSLCAVLLVTLFSYDGMSNLLGANKSAFDSPSNIEMAAPMAASDSAEEMASEPRLMFDEVESEKPVLLNWVPAAGVGGGGGSGPREIWSSTPEDESPIEIQPQVASAQPEQDPIEEELIHVHIHPISGAVTICDPIDGCGYGSSSGAVSEKENEHWVNPDLIYLDPITGEHKLCEKPGACGESAGIFASGKGADESSDEITPYESAFPLILGLDHENEGEVLSVSPSIEHEDLEAKLSEQAGDYAGDVDHQRYLQNQLKLWLKIGLASLAALFAVIWLIIRRN